MCAGMAVMFGPPSVGGACYYVWTWGKARLWRGLKREAPTTGSISATLASVTTLGAAYLAQLKVVVTHFDQGGALSLNWKKGTESLGQPLKIQTWGHFYRAAGPPVFARVGALITSFYVAGYAHGWVVARSLPQPKPQPKKRQK
jgi:hypothetical protein